MAMPCVKNHYGRTYFDEFMPTCLRGAGFLRHSVVYYTTAGGLCKLDSYHLRRTRLFVHTFGRLLGISLRPLVSKRTIRIHDERRRRRSAGLDDSRLESL